MIVTLSRHVDGYLMAAECPAVSLSVAVSCLIEPQSGDCVALLLDQNNGWITDVLHCADPTRTLVLRSQHAELAIEADNLSLRAGQTLAIESPSVTLLAHSSRWIAEKMTQMAGHLQIRCRNAERLVSESDIVTAEHIQHQASASYCVDSEMTAVNGRSVLKIDGGQVHVG